MSTLLLKVGVQAHWSACSERGMQRFYVLLDGEITQEKTEASIRRHMAPHTVEFTHIEWFSKFESKTPLYIPFLR